MASDDDRKVNVTRAFAPHCDQSVLHAPGTCEHCDGYPDWQEFRVAQRINFTDEHDPAKAPCPSTSFRPEQERDRWAGNVATVSYGLSRPGESNEPVVTLTGVVPPAASSLRERRSGDQKYPAVNTLPSMHDKARRDLDARKSVGVERYGVALQPANGRDAIRDWYEEALDGVVYGAQAAWEQANPKFTYVGCLIRAAAALEPGRTVHFPADMFVPDAVVDSCATYGLTVSRE